MATSSESINATLRLIDFFTIPRSQGDCVVLLLVHPGINSLGRYYPPAKVNDILLGDVSRVRSLSHGDMYMIEDSDTMEEVETCDMMDLATFLEYVLPCFQITSPLSAKLQGSLSKPPTAWSYFIGEGNKLSFQGDNFTAI